MVLDKSKLKRVIQIIAIILLVCAIVYIIYSFGSFQEVPLPSVTPHPTPQIIVREKEVERIISTEKNISADTLEDGLKELGLLLTEEYYFTDVVSFSSIKKFLIEWKFTESSYLVSYDGVVTAGIDCAKIHVEKDDDAKTIIIKIPSAIMQPANIDPNSLTVYSERSGTGNPISVEDFNSSLIELEATVEKKAVARGLLDRANENAQRMITSFVSSFVDLTEYSIDFIIT